LFQAQVLSEEPALNQSITGNFRAGAKTGLFSAGSMFQASLLHGLVKLVLPLGKVPLPDKNM
jgi:hypothetical protein